MARKRSASVPVEKQAEEIAKALVRLDEDELIDPEDVSALPAGTIYETTLRNGKTVTRKRQWRKEDLKRFAKVFLIPEITTPVTWNGITIQFVAGKEIEVPSPFAGVYFDSRRDTRNAGNIAENLHTAGALTEADRNISPGMPASAPVQ